MAWALIYGLKNGDPEKLWTLYESDGKGCGKDSGYEDYDLIYWPSLNYATQSDETICVKFCPTIANPLTSSDCKTNSKVASCTAPPVPYDSKEYVSRFCIPDTESVNSNASYESFENSALSDYSGEFFSNYMGDLFICWWVLIASAGIAFVISICYMFFIR